MQTEKWHVENYIERDYKLYQNNVLKSIYCYGIFNKHQLKIT